MIGRTERVTGYAILTLASGIAVLPLLGVLVMALNPADSLSATPSLSEATHLGNFAAVWQQAGFGAALRSSAIIAVPTVAITVAVSVPAGYAFAIMKFRGRSLLFYTLLLGLLVPVEAMIIPLYFDLRPFGLTGNYWGVILPETGLSIAFGSFWMRAFFLSAPVWTWNDFLLPLVMLSGSSIQTAPISLVYFQGQHTTDFAYLAGAAVITAIPVVMIYVLLQRSFVRGMLSGAMKG
jgi:raffinose/stachyose/melibiose transport system permease protein